MSNVNVRGVGLENAFVVVAAIVFSTAVPLRRVRGPPSLPPSHLLSSSQPLVQTLSALVWPLNSLAASSSASLRKSPEEIAKAGGAAVAFKGKGVANTLEDHLGVLTGTLPKLLVAQLVWYLLNWARDGGARFATLDYKGWVAEVVLRDLVITYLTAGFCDWKWSSMGPFHKVYESLKFTPGESHGETRYLLGCLPVSQLSHDMFWSTCSTLISSAIEVAVLHAWVTKGGFGFAAPFAAGAMQGASVAQWWTHTPTLVWLFTMPYWRLAHFYCVHRMMHKWHTRSSESWLLRQVPDFGDFLYKNVHALHHLSKNPTAWSGVSMHPVESTIYYTAMLIPVLLGAHPIVLFYTKFDLTMAALIGHDGYGFPGGGSQPHWLHHAMVDVNYGENYAPFDWLFGTFAATEEDAVKLRAARTARKKTLGVTLDDSDEVGAAAAKEASKKGK